MSTDWTFEGYWNAVFGDKRTPERCVLEFGLSHDSVVGFVRRSEYGAVDQGAIPDENWEEYRTEALDLLLEAVEACDD